ncbi:MAG: hypothetical protein ACXWTP_12645 [Methylosarcina sp.]
MSHSFWQQLDEANNEQDVRRRIAEGLYSQPALGIAQEWLRSKDEERAKQRQADLIAEIKRPHWSVTPGFLVGVVAMIASCIAAYYSYLAYAQTHQVDTEESHSAKIAR